MSKVQAYKELFRTLGIIYKTDYESERQVRKAIELLKAEGIVFIKSDIGTGVYVRKEHASEKEIKQYDHAENSRFKNHYFHTKLPAQHIAEDLVGQKIHGRLEGTMNEIYKI